jgi:hydroxyacylglutathione hydrolase
MIFERFVEDGLSHFSYIVGDEDTREAVIVDPRRDGDVFIDWLEDRDLDLVGIVETHLHADFASGAHELAEAYQVPHYLSAYDKNERYVAQYDHVGLEDGDTVNVGSLTFEAVHTPGHTPEHLSYLLYDESSSETPEKMFTGDFMFVGSLGRPDLIGEDEKNRLASMLFESVQMVKERDWPDELEILPAHGAGSLCGAGLDEKPSSTLGEEKQNNRYFQFEDEDAFVEAVFEALGEFPPYYTRMKETNSEGASSVLPIQGPPECGVEDLEKQLTTNEDTILLDVREQDAYSHGHVPGSYNLPFGPKINMWAPWVLDYDEPIFLIGNRSMGDEEMEEIYRILIRVELDRVEGYLRGGFASWASENPGRTESVDLLTPRDFVRELEDDPTPFVLDVRTEDEYEEEHVPGSEQIMLGLLPDRLDRLPENQETPIVTICPSGYRATFANSILQRHGYRNVGLLAGGINALKEHSPDSLEVGRA